MQILFTNSAYANDVIYSCRGEQGVGFNSRDLSPTTFTPIDIQLTRVNKFGLIEAAVFNKNSGWTNFGSVNDGENTPTFINIVGTYSGVYFYLDVKTSRFSYTNTTGFLIGQSSPPQMYVGFCRKH